MTWPSFCGLIIQERIDQWNKCPGPNETGTNIRRDGWSGDGKRRRTDGPGRNGTEANGAGNNDSGSYGAGENLPCTRTNGLVQDI
jgi:hypothetical protein